MQLKKTCHHFSDMKGVDSFMFDIIMNKIKMPYKGEKNFRQIKTSIHWANAVCKRVSAHLGDGVHEETRNSSSEGDAHLGDGVGEETSLRVLREDK